ncbi:UNVERIFIED_CONTAM: hypothetical protein NCL1_31884 [Trichonephila clavipes]
MSFSFFFDRLAEQAQRMLERGARFENLCLGENRPTALIRQYGNLYAQARIDTLDSLDTLAPLRDADELKTKILFSVIAYDPKPRGTAAKTDDESKYLKLNNLKWILPTLPYLGRFTPCHVTEQHAKLLSSKASYLCSAMYER